jgi:murein DD-endopeptidase MepM/ murein hydrolase activator NlpD
MIVFLLLLLLAGPAWGETFALGPAQAVVCRASPDARYSLEQGELRPVSGLFTFSPPGEQPLEPFIALPSRAAPGDAVRVQARSGERLSTLTVALTDARGRAVSSTSVFRLPGPAPGDGWAALAGIPSTAAPGRYLLEVKGEAGGKSFQLLSPLEVTGRAFASETIALSADMTTLRTAPDPRKTAEALALARLLSTSRPDSLFTAGIFSHPLASGWRQTAAFGDRRRYRYSDGGSDLAVHNGLDMAAPTGTAVFAPAAGRVAFAGDRIVTGKSVVVEHLPGLFSICYHLSEITVREGDILEAGQPLGKVGMTGLATGPHLHWEVQVLGTPVDPDGFLRRAVLDTAVEFGDSGHTCPKGGDFHSVHRSGRG